MEIFFCNTLFLQQIFVPDNKRGDYVRNRELSKNAAMIAVERGTGAIAIMTDADNIQRSA